METKAEVYNCEYIYNDCHYSLNVATYWNAIERKQRTFYNCTCTNLSTFQRLFLNVSDRDYLGSVVNENILWENFYNLIDSTDFKTDVHADAFLSLKDELGLIQS